MFTLWRFVLLLFLTDRLNQETEISLIEMLLINHSFNMNFERKKKKET